MQTSTILYVVAAAIVALGLVLFQYYYKSKKRGKLIVGLSFLRFIGLFSILLLLINPKFTKNEYTIEKANLIVLTDNSSSMATSKTNISKILKELQENDALHEKFTVTDYAFGSNLAAVDSLSFKQNNTNISKVLKQVATTYSDSNTAVVLLTDGNQTIGEDYSFIPNQLKHVVYPIAVGDTTHYEDLRIATVNSNKFAFLKNKYPIEFSVSYSGLSNVNTRVSIVVDGRSVYSKNIKLSNSNTVETINTLLNANSVGVKNISIVVDELPNERNIKNNKKNIAIEVIDEKTNIAIISDLKHPDIGALKKAIESNEQRSVTIKKPTVTIKELEDVDVFIFYQPTASFTSIYKYVQQKKSSLFTIVGKSGNVNFLNQIQTSFKVDGSYPAQETFPVLNTGFTKFDISDFKVSDYPPLNYGAGLLDYGDSEVLLQMKIMGQVFDTPMLFATDKNTGKELVLLGENLWKWRMQSFRNDQNFENFDAFIGKLMLYLASNENKNRLVVDYQSIYEGSNEAKIKASYFDEAFVFDSNATLVLKLTNKEKGTISEIPMLLAGDYYEADLTYLTPGDYTFKLTVAEGNRSKTGNFTILDFDVEQQFTATNYIKLGQLANNTNGSLYFPDKLNDLIAKLKNDSQFVPTQKSTKNIVSLIDFRLLLSIIIAALSVEWFLRKYNGLT